MNFYNSKSVHRISFRGIARSTGKGAHQIWGRIFLMRKDASKTVEKGRNGPEGSSIDVSNAY